MIDSRTQHNTAVSYQKTLIEKAACACGSINELCLRAGVSRDYLLKLKKGDRAWAYSLQYLLESLAAKE